MQRLTNARTGSRRVAKMTGTPARTGVDRRPRRRQDSKGRTRGRWKMCDGFLATRGQVPQGLQRDRPVGQIEVLLGLSLDPPERLEGRFCATLLWVPCLGHWGRVDKGASQGRQRFKGPRSRPLSASQGVERWASRVYEVPLPLTIP